MTASGVLAEGIIRQIGHDTLRAGDAAEAIAVLDVARGIDLLFTDIRLTDDPHGGITVAKHARTKHPQIAVVYTAGSGVNDGTRALFVERYWFVPKPYRPGDLEMVLGNALSGKNPEKQIRTLQYGNLGNRKGRNRQEAVCDESGDVPNDWAAEGGPYFVILVPSKTSVTYLQVLRYRRQFPSPCSPNLSLFRHAARNSAQSPPLPRTSPLPSSGRRSGPIRTPPGPTSNL